MSEIDIQRQIQLALSNGNIRLWRNNTGDGWQGKIIRQTPTQITLEHYRHIKFGLATGSSDLIGLMRVTIEPDMIGRRLPVFLAVEVKDKKPTTPEQQRFIEFIRECGGIAGVARSVDDAIKIVTSFSQ